MFELNGKYNTCKVFTDNCDGVTVSQLTNLLNQECVAGSQIRIMPDTHAGKGCVIGTTMTITDKVIPNLVGVDIGCGMLTAKLAEKEIDLEKLDKVIRENVPSGFEIRSVPHDFIVHTCIESLHASKFNAVNIERAEKSLGTLGGGNHFIEVDKDDDDNLYLVIHTGSRHLGKQVAEYYQGRAWEKLKDGNRSELIQQKIKELTEAGQQQLIESAIAEIKSTVAVVDKDLAYCEGDLFDMYIEDMKVTQEYAHWNREAILDTIVSNMGLTVVKKLHTVHNYIDTEDMVLRKGAVSAKLGEILLIPINMRDGSLICMGRGKPDWNFSAPHGAGRLMSRSQAKQAFSVEDFQKTMADNGVYTTSANQSTIDECPMAYKPMQEIIDNVYDTVDIVVIIKPIYNFKAGGE